VCTPVNLDVKTAFTRWLEAEAAAANMCVPSAAVEGGELWPWQKKLPPRINGRRSHSGRAKTRQSALAFAARPSPRRSITIFNAAFFKPSASQPASQPASRQRGRRDKSSMRAPCSICERVRRDAKQSFVIYLSSLSPFP